MKDFFHRLTRSTASKVNRGLSYIANDPLGATNHLGSKIKSGIDHISVSWTSQKIADGYTRRTQKIEKALSEDWNRFYEWSKNDISPFFTGLQTEGKKLYEESMRDMISYTKTPLESGITSIFGMHENEVQRASNLLTNGCIAITSEVIFHPINTGENLANVVRNGIQRAVYTPEKHNSIPDSIKDPVIIAIYHIGNKITLPGHAALWYQGQTIDASGGNRGFLKSFSPNSATIGQEKTSWGKEGPFRFNINKNCDLYVIDAAKLGFDTPEKKQEFLNNILKEQQNKVWDVNNRNCSTIVNNATNDAFVDTDRAANNGLRNFDFPLSIGANLDRKCQEGIAYALTPEAVVKYGQSLANNENRGDIKALLSMHSDKTSGTQASEEEKGKNNINLNWFSIINLQK